jgi:ATP-dependent RNA helicase DDX20
MYFLDMIVSAKSGTGKTLLFAIVLLEQYAHSLPFPQALIIVPTREIAIQIESVLNDLGKGIKSRYRMND